MEHGHHRTEQKCTLIISKLELIIRWAILENVFCMHTAHPYLPPIPSHRHTDVHYKLLGSENLGKKKLAAGSDTDSHRGIETCFQSSAATAAGSFDLWGGILVSQTPN